MTTYPPPPFSGGYPYAYPSAAAYPPPASGFFPAAYHPPFHMFTAPYAFPAPITTQIDPNWPPLAPNWPTWPPPSHPSAPPTLEPPITGTPAISVLPDRDSSSPVVHTPFNRPPSQAATQLHPPQSHNSSTPTSSTSDLTAPAASHISFVTKEVSTYLPNDGGNPSPPPPPTTDNRMQQDRVSAGLNDLAQQLKIAHRSLLDMNRRLNELHSRSQHSVASLQGQLSELVSTAPSSASSTTTDHTPSIDPKVFVEMPAPNSWQGTYDIAPGYENCYYGYPNQIQSSCVQEGSSSLSEKYVDEVPQSYGFHNLNRQSIFLADGTERSYFTLPADYPLEQASPPMSPSAGEIVGGMAPQSVAVQAAGLAPVVCSKANGSAGSESLLVHVVQPPMTVRDVSNVSKEMEVNDVCAEDATVCRSCLHPTVDISTPDNELFIVYDDKSEGRSNESARMFTGIPEQQKFQEKRESCQAPKCFSKPTFSPERPTVGTVGVFNLTSEQSTCDLEKLNDGENSLFVKQDIEQLLSCSSKASKCKICDEEAQGDEKIFWDRTVCRTAIGHSILSFLWDPGDTKYHDLSITATGATKLQWTYVYKSAMVQILAVQFGSRRAPIFESAIMRSYTLRWTEVIGSVLFVQAVSCSTCTFVAKQSMLPSHSDNSRTNHSSPKLVMHSLYTITVVQVTKQKHPLEFLLVTEMLHNASEFRDGQVAYMSQDTSVGCSKLGFPAKADAYVSRYINLRQHLPVTSFRYAGSSATGFGYCEWLPFSTQNISVYWDSDIAPHQVQLAQRIRYHTSFFFF